MMLFAGYTQVVDAAPFTGSSAYLPLLGFFFLPSLAPLLYRELTSKMALIMASVCLVSLC